ncbi:hypothetical protein NO2_0875 [Candidatus Termititenax persephonae]|uniref:Uncharacterized protein n=1 Tax=Candidatus Termititenax persephonae TaxID=2218525 RepID=A0A388THI4_9BACT|nr:hypothetical protein NO2_0875 [Candidatus Termititenax persephonae]
MRYARLLLPIFWGVSSLVAATENSLIENIPSNNLITINTAAAPPESGIQIHGNKSIIFINRTRHGAVNFPVEQRRVETLYLEADGQESSVNVEARIFTTSQESVDKKEDIKIKLSGDAWSAYMGDFTETVASSGLNLRQKNLNGLRFAYFPAEPGLVAIVGKEAGVNQEEYFYGNDSQGPYALQHPPVVPGSEEIFLDGLPLLRDKDYQFDHRGGKIIFRQKIIAQHQQIQVLYQSETTPYKNQFLHARGGHNWGAWLLRASATEAKDLHPQIVSGNAPPLVRRQYTMQALYAERGTTLNIEKAVSAKDSAVNAANVSPSRGEALAVGWEYANTENITIALTHKNSDADFAPIGNPTPPGLQENKIFGELQEPGYTLRADLQTKEQKISANSSSTKENYYKVYLPENFWPETQFWSKETRREIAAQSATLNVVQQYRGQNLELSKSLYSWRAGLTGSQENIENQLDALPYTQAQTSGVYLQTDGNGMDFSISQKGTERELRDARRLVSSNARRRETSVRLNLYPHGQIRLDSSYQHILDDLNGDSTLAEIDYALSPSRFWNSNGNYSSETLLETFASANYRTQKQRGNFLLRLQPGSRLRVALRYSPNISLAENSLPYSRAVLQNAALDYAPLNWLTVKYAYTGNQSKILDTADLSAQSLKSETDNQENLYVLRWLPLDNLDWEFLWRVKRQLDNFRDENTSGNVYSEGLGRETENSLTLYYRPRPRLQLTNGYSVSRAKMDYQNLPSRNIQMTSEKYNTAAEYAFSDHWTLYAGCDFLQIRDQLAATHNLTYEYAPSIGLGCRYTEFRLRYDYKKIELVQGGHGRRRQHDLSLEYYWNTYWQTSLAVEKVHSEIPRYATTDILGKFSASF